MLVIGNGRMITRDASNPFMENGAVAMDGNTIVMVGVTEEVKKAYPDAEFIDAKGGVIMPAFINAHEHIYSSFARGLSINGYNPKGFLDILDGLWWTVDRHLTLEQTKLSAYATYIDSIKNGVTTVFDHHASFGHITGSLNAIEEAAKDLGVRTCLCYEISDRDGMEKSKESVMENVNFIKHALADDSDMIAGMMGMHAQFTISDETMEYVGILAKLELSDAEKEAAKKDMESMLDYIDKLNELDTSNVEPMSHVFPVQNVFREDVVENGDGGEDTLANAPERRDRAFVVPKTVE